MRKEEKLIAALQELKGPCEGIDARAAAVRTEGEKMLQELEALGQSGIGERTKALGAAVVGLSEEVKRLLAAIAVAVDVLVQPAEARDEA